MIFVKFVLWDKVSKSSLCVGFVALCMLRVVKGIFVIRDRPLFIPVKCEMAIFFLVNRDFYSSREP